MRIDHGVLDASARLAIIALSAAGCNTVLGVDDVALGSPDATACDVDSHFQTVSAATAPAASLSHIGTNVPFLLILLDRDTRPDSLILRLIDNMGHGMVNMPGPTIQLTATDAKPETCGICASIEADFDSTTKTFGGTYAALGQGDLSLTTADTTRLAGSLHNLKFRHIDPSGGNRDIDDGCTVTIDTVEFDLMYSVSAR
jgi:hypothetical protein